MKFWTFSRRHDRPSRQKLQILSSTLLDLFLDRDAHGGQRLPLTIMSPPSQPTPSKAALAEVLQSFDAKMYSSIETPEKDEMKAVAVGQHVKLMAGCPVLTPSSKAFLLSSRPFLESPSKPTSTRYTARVLKLASCYVGSTSSTQNVEHEQSVPTSTSCEKIDKFPMNSALVSIPESEGITALSSNKSTVACSEDQSSLRVNNPKILTATQVKTLGVGILSAHKRKTLWDACLEKKTYPTLQKAKFHLGPDVYIFLTRKFPTITVREFKCRKSSCPYHSRTTAPIQNGEVTSTISPGILLQIRFLHNHETSSWEEHLDDSSRQGLHPLLVEAIHEEQVRDKWRAIKPTEMARRVIERYSSDFQVVPPQKRKRIHRQIKNLVVSTKRSARNNDTKPTKLGSLRFPILVTADIIRFQEIFKLRLPDHGFQPKPILTEEQARCTAKYLQVNGSVMLKGGITDMPHCDLCVLPVPTVQQQPEMLRVQSLNAKHVGKQDVFANTVVFSSINLLRTLSTCQHRFQMHVMGSIDGTHSIMRNTRILVREIAPC